MTQQTKKNCPNCGADNPYGARFCNNCGTALPRLQSKSKTLTSNAGLNADLGETDLVEDQVNWRAGSYIFASMLFISLMACGILVAVLNGTIPLNLSDEPSRSITPSVAANSGNAAPPPIAPSTSTPRPTLLLITVTPEPPTITPTPTQGPCQIEVRANDTLIGIIGRCGHRDLDIMNEVMEINNLSDAGALSLGQIIEVPRPTEIPDPNAQPSDGNTNPETGANNDTDNNFTNLIFAEGADGLPTFTPTPSPTLPPGIQWHVVQPNENVITVAFQYGANVQILSQLNPEITFAQCDFGKPTGGPDCTVSLFVGQFVRVPAPTPTPTLSPTPSGSETPTPSATPTFNAPNLISPGNRMLFLRSQLVTLRWSGTGSLGEDQVYRVRVNDLTLEREYVVDTTETTFILPSEWQGTDGTRHDYTWQVSVINRSNPDNPRFITESRLFTWEANSDPTDKED